MLFADIFKFFAAMVFAPSSTPTPSALNNVLLIILENVDYSSAIADPNLRAFASSGVLFSNWIAISHPSQPNYIAMTSGAINGVWSDASKTIHVNNIADLLEEKGLTWKSHQEDWPGNCFTGAISSDRLYYRLV
jgi:Phosphoesterase family